MYRLISLLALMGSVAVPQQQAASPLPLDTIKLPPGFSIELYSAEVPNARQMALGDKGTVFVGSRTAGHPEYGHAPGVETTTGPLGQGLATAVGMAMAERKMAARFGEDLVDHRTWVVAGDGCLMEGVSHEAISLAGRLKLNRLTVLWDDNDITIDGRVGLSDATDQLARFKAAGWAVKRIDGHDEGQIRRALAWAAKQDKPSLIACKTVIGKGSPTGVKFGTKSQFPPHFQRALYVLDWAYGRIVAVHLIPHGAGYVARAETFLKGRPLNVTDLGFGPDGALYFVTGGRKTQAALYRVRYTGPAVAEGCRRQRAWRYPPSQV